MIHENCRGCFATELDGSCKLGKKTGDFFIAGLNYFRPLEECQKPIDNTDYLRALGLTGGLKRKKRRKYRRRNHEK